MPSKNLVSLAHALSLGARTIASPSPPEPAMFPNPIPSFQLTHHASIRLQQRGIPAWFLSLLVCHGKTAHDGHGAVLKTVDKDTH